MIRRCLAALALLAALTWAAPRTLAGDVNLSFEHLYDGPAA